MTHSDDLYRPGDDAKQSVFIPEEHESGFQARLRGAHDFKTATPSWRAGWQDADREINNRSPLETTEHPGEARPAPRWGPAETAGQMLQQMEALHADDRGQASNREADQARADSGQTVPWHTAPWHTEQGGRITRICELPFDPSCGIRWKHGWIEADIELGLKRKRRP